jgi:hypothetical protein
VGSTARLCTSAKDNWTNEIRDAGLERWTHSNKRGETFLALAWAVGHRSYVRKDRGRCSICIGKARPSNARLHRASRLTCRLRFQTIAALTALRELWIRILSLWNLFQVKVQIQISILETSQFWGRFLLLLHEERQSLRGSKEFGPWLQTTKILILYGAEADLECDIEIDHSANTNLECDIGLGPDEKIYKRKIYSSPSNVLRSTFGHPKAQQLKFPLPNKANHSRRRMFIEKLTDKFT